MPKELHTQNICMANTQVKWFNDLSTILFFSEHPGHLFNLMAKLLKRQGSSKELGSYQESDADSTGIRETIIFDGWSGPGGLHARSCCSRGYTGTEKTESVKLTEMASGRKCRKLKAEAPISSAFRETNGLAAHLSF